MTNRDFHTAAEGPRADRPKRRVFTPAYKLRIVEAYGSAPTDEKGALLRREGLYDPSVQLWRKQRDAGELSVGAIPTAGRYGASHGEAFNSSPIRA